jgi:hypothetical protein
MAPDCYWDCHGKKGNGKPCGYKVPLGEISCNSCGHQPPPHVSCPGRHGRQDKAQAAAKKEDNGNNKRARRQPAAGAADSGKLKAALEANKETAKSLNAAKAELKKLKAEAVAAAASRAAPGNEVPMDQDGADPATGDCLAAIAQARDELKQLQGCTDFYKSIIPDYPAKVVEAQAKLDAATAARRAAGPLKKQLEGAEFYQLRMDKKLADAEASLEAKRQQLSEAELALQAQQAMVTEAAATATKAAAAVAQLAARFAAERNAPSPQLQAPATTGLPAQGEQVQPAPGFVSIVLAEQKWLEREAAFAQQLAALQALVLPAEDGTSEAPSEAGDIDVPDSIDDGAWNTVDRSKRPQLLRRQRDILARNVRSKLGKVGTVSSPFSKA